ncbi:MAG: glycosyltransferase family 2 protein [Muribaculaceae bacterium]|nr:glycosyltransferase family 2 protein [Muribaculaceae bacterium]
MAKEERLTLDVAISTFRPEGIERVVNMLKDLPEKEEVKYIVSWQEHQDSTIPSSLSERSDVEIYRYDKKGLSNNRNNAMGHCKGDIVLIADDDLEYYPDFADKVLEPFRKDQGIDLATFKFDFLHKKHYPQESCLLRFPYPKNYFCSSIEISYRRETVGNLRFWPELGLGAEKMHCGEEELFLASAIRRGLSCRFINDTIGKHSQASTGDKQSEEVLRAQGFIIAIHYPWSFLPRLALKARRITKSGNDSIIRAFKYLWQGAIDAKLRFRKIPQCYRW